MAIMAISHPIYPGHYYEMHCKGDTPTKSEIRKEINFDNITFFEKRHRNAFWYQHYKPKVSLMQHTHQTYTKNVLKQRNHKHIQSAIVN
jgi:hypothetical protein